MMKKFFLTFVAIFCYMMTTAVFTACSKDSDDGNSGTNQKQVVSIYYEFTVSQAYLDYYDVYCIYTDVNGVVQKEKCTSPASYYKKSVEYDKAPSSYEFSVIGIPKEPLPDIDPEGVYDVSHSYNVNVCVRPSADSEKINKTIITDSSSSKKSTKGSRLKEILAEGEREIIKKLTGTK